MKTTTKILLGASLLSVACTQQAKQTEVEQERPNILFILSDDHTSQAWGVYGGLLAQYAKNENIKRLAKEGCVLDNCFCTNSLSAPSRASIITGSYSATNGVFTLNNRFDEKQDNLAKRMQAGGYQTALFGKWHLKSQPAGFDDYAVFFDQGRYIDPILKTPINWVPGKDIGDTIKGFSTDIVTDKTIAWIKNRKKGQPFMMSCHFKATHEPWDFPERNKHLYDDVTFPEPEDLFTFDWEATGRTFEGQPLENLAIRWETATKTGQWWCQYPELPFQREGKSPEQDREQIYQKLIRDYLRCGATIDQNIGRLLDCLDQEGLTQNTIVVYVADQGYFLGEHGFFDKRMMLEQALRMPFVIRYPKEIPAGTRNKDIILNIDFAATLADYAEVKAPAQSQGESFRANLKGETPKDWRNEMYYHYWVNQDTRPAHIGIRNERYKLMFLYGLPLDLNGKGAKAVKPSWEFYDLKKNPKELYNQYKDPTYGQMIWKMKKDLVRLRSTYENTSERYPALETLLKKQGLK